jgi:hypothetical protein
MLNYKCNSGNYNLYEYRDYIIHYKNESACYLIRDINLLE